MGELYEGEYLCSKLSLLHLFVFLTWTQFRTPMVPRFEGLAGPPTSSAQSLSLSSSFSYWSPGRVALGVAATPAVAGYD